MKRVGHIVFLVVLVLVLLLTGESWAAKPASKCGDGNCRGKETTSNCPEDCPVDSICGDGVIDPGEECDDENTTSGDGCSAMCITEGEPIPELSLKAIQFDAHNGDAVRAVGFADGAGGAWVISGGEDANLRSWYFQEFNEADQQVSFQTLNHTIYDLAASVDGSIFATGEGGWNGSTDSFTLRIWDANELFWAPNTAFQTGTRVPIGYVYCVAISPDNKWTVASGFYGDIVVYSTTDLVLHATKATKKKRTKALAFSPDGSILASTSAAGMIQLWSFPKDSCSPESCELDLLPVSLSHSGSWSFPIAFYPIETSGAIEIVSGTDSGEIKVWTIDNPAQPNPSVSVISVDSGPVYCLAWSPDGTKIAVGGDGDITVYDAGSLEILFQNVNAHANRVNDMAFSPDSTLIASVGDDGALKLWDIGG